MPKEKQPKHTRAGKLILAALQEIVVVLESGDPLEKHFAVREIVVPDPGEYDAKTVKAVSPPA